MKTRTETFRCYLKIMSPVHIGCDEVYEPTSFVVDETDKSGPKMIVFDPLEFISGLDEGERKRFSEICKKGSVVSILELYKFLRGKKAVGKDVALSPHFVEHYKTVLKLTGSERNITQNLNNFQIKRTSFRSYDERPYIPGTAIKGALRTAYLNFEAKTKRGNNSKSQELQASLMDYDSGKIETDPFRLVKISDFMPVGNTKTKVIYSVNRKKKISDKQPELYQIIEVIEPNGIFKGEISVESPISNKYIKTPVTLAKLLASTIQFYSTENSRESSELFKINVDSIKIADQNNMIPIRIGRHSGAESITVEEYRRIKIRLGNKESTTLNHATTFWLSSETNKPSSTFGLKPFGWACLSEITTEKEKKFSDDELVFRSEFERKESERLDAAETAKEEALKRMEEKNRREEEVRLKEFEKEKKTREDAEKKAMLEALSPAEKCVVQLSDFSFSEQEAVKIYEALNSLVDEEKIKVASALKEYWIKIKKWSAKDCSKKQVEKVKEIKKILGEA